MTINTVSLKINYCFCVNIILLQGCFTWDLHNSNAMLMVQFYHPLFRLSYCETLCIEHHMTFGLYFIQMYHLPLSFHIFFLC